MRENRFTPLPEVNSEVVSFNINLPPYIDQERFGVNVRALQKLCKLGGIKHLDIRGISGSRQEDTDALITGFDRFGNATAGGIKTRTRERFQTQGDSDPNHTVAAFSWINAGIHIDFHSISTHITESSSELRSHHAWAKEMNIALKKGVNSIGTNHLLHVDDMEKTLALLFNGTGLVNSGVIPGLDPYLIFNLPLPDDTPQALAIFLAFESANQFSNAVQYLSVRRKGIKEDYRPSLLAHVHLDRALALNILSRTSTLVKELPLKKE